MRMNTKISVGILGVFIVGAGIIVLANRGGGTAPKSVNASLVNQTIAASASATPVPQTTQKAATSAGAGSSASTAAPASNAPTSYTLAQVSAHNNATSCWSAINGKVYDLTSWINQHPGGPKAILSICGTDGSSAFNDQHGGQSRPANELAGFSIGTLAQ